MSIRSSNRLPTPSPSTGKRSEPILLSRTILYTEVDVPFQAKIFCKSSKKIIFSSTGVLFFDDGYVLGTNTPLPTLDAPRESIFAYWDYIATFDTHVIGHGMFWANDINSFTVRYNGWVVGTTITDKFDMTVYYTNNTPGIWYIYYDTAGLGTLGHSATIGAQSGETFVQFAYNRPGSVTSGTRLAIDTNCQGSFTKG